MITQMIFFGPFVWWIALTYGIILIVRAFNQDFSNHNRNTVVYNLKEHRFALNREFTFKFRFIIFKNIKSLMIRKWYRKLDFFDMTAIIGLLIFLPVQQFQGWMLADTLPLILDNVFSTVVMFIILTLIFLFVCLPVNVIELKTSSITYRIQTSLKSEEKSLLKKMVLHFLEKVKSISDQAMKRVFLIRVASISSIIIGVCIYMIIYFNFFF
jgi:hypothetical protein